MFGTLRFVGPYACSTRSMPVAAALDAVRAGDALQVTARPSLTWREEPDAPVRVQLKAAG